MVDDETHKLCKLIEIIEKESTACVVLCNDAGSAEFVSINLTKNGFEVYTVHGEKSSLEASRFEDFSSCLAKIAGGMEGEAYVLNPAPYKMRLSDISVNNTRAK